MAKEKYIHKSRTEYGWTYNKAGKLVQVLPPRKADGTLCEKPNKIHTGALLGGVGFGGNIGERTINKKTK